MANSEDAESLSWAMLPADGESAFTEGAEGASTDTDDGIETAGTELKPFLDWLCSFCGEEEEDDEDIGF